MNSYSPLVSLRGHRFVYIFSDTQQQRPKNFLITPFLHDKKIYLNRMKLNTEYFYTSVEVTLQQLNAYMERVLEDKNALRSQSGQRAVERKDSVKIECPENKKRSASGGLNLRKK